MPELTCCYAPLPSSLTAGFPAIPPACLYTLQTTNEELQRLLSCTSGVEQPQDETLTRHRGSNKPASPSEAEDPGSALVGSPVESVNNGAAASLGTSSPHSAGSACGARDTSPVTHSCIVFSRWTPYKSVLGKSSIDPWHSSLCKSKGSQAEALKRSSELTTKGSFEWVRERALGKGQRKGPFHDPRASCKLDRKSVEELKRYEELFLEANKQYSSHQAGKIATQGGLTAGGSSGDKTKEQGEHGSSPNSLGIIMKELRSLDPAQFLLLYSRMQKELRAASMAAASPVPPSFSHLKRQQTFEERRRASDEWLLAQNMGQLKLDQRCPPHCCCLQPEVGTQGSTKQSVPGEKHPPTEALHAVPVSAAQPSNCHMACSSPTGSEEARTTGANKWEEWRACGETEFDPIGNETGCRYYLREQLSQQYWQGLLLDSKSWFEMTAEPIASYMSLKLHAHSFLQRELETLRIVMPSFPHIWRSNNNTNPASSTSSDSTTQGLQSVLRSQQPRPIVAADGCCGAGGDVRQLSRHFDMVLGVDKDLLRVALCRHNTELLASQDPGCAPVILLHQQLQHLAAFRGGWSVRDPESVAIHSRNLTLAALTKHQEAINQSFPQTTHSTEVAVPWNIKLGLRSPSEGCALSEGSPGEFGERPKTLEVACPGQGGRAEKCLCTPFSRLPCRLCMASSVAIDDLVRTWHESKCQPAEPVQNHTDENQGNRYRESRVNGLVQVTPDAILPVDWLYMSPPWGGENYEGHRDFLTTRYFLSKHKLIVDLILSAARVAPNVCLFMPRSTDLHEIFVLASLLHFPLVEVEVLYLPTKQSHDWKSNNTRSTVEPSPVYPKAVIIYLVREVHAWVMGRGVPSDIVYSQAVKGPCRGWCSSEGATKLPCKAARGVNVALRANNKLDFAFCELPLASEQSVDQRASHDRNPVPPTADIFLDDGARRSTSVSFTNLLHAVASAMTTLQTAGSGGTPPHPEAVDVALKCGALEVALAAFSTLCGPDMERSFCRLARSD